MADKKPSILFVNRVFPPDKGATALRLFELADVFAHKGWDVTVLAAHGLDETPKNLHANIRLRRLKAGKTVYPVPFSHYPWLLICFTLKLLFMKRHDVTVTMTDPPFLSVASALAGIFRRTKTIHWSQDVYPDILPVLGVKFGFIIAGIMKAVQRWALRRHDRIVPIARDMAAVIKEKGVVPEKVFIINNWPDRFFDDEHDGKVKGENPFAHPEAMTFLYSGNFGLAHDFDIILEGIKLLEKKDEPIRFIFAGHGRRYAEVQEKVAEMELSSVQFLAFQPENRLKELLSAGDVHLANMKEEAWGLLMPSKVNSAFALSKPVIYVGPPDSEAAKLIRQFEAGRVIDPADDNARFVFARAVTDMGLHKKIWADAARGSAKCAEAISLEKMGDAFEKLARDMLKEKK